MGKAHVPTDVLRTVVTNLAADGVPITKIGAMIGLGKTSMHKYYQRELDTATVKKIRQLSGKAYELALKGNVTMLIFLLKTQGGWKEPKEEIAEVDKEQEVGKIQIQMITSKKDINE